MGARIIVAISLPILIVIFLAIGNDQVIHWFLIPVILNGCISVYFIYDILKTGKLYQITSIPHFMFFHLLFLSQLLHVYWDFYYPYPGPPDYRVWLGIASTFNFMGYIMYIFIVHTMKQTKNKRQTYISMVNKVRFTIYYPVILGAVGVVFLYTYVSMGGLAGIIKLSDSRIGAGPGGNPFIGSGILLMVAEALPIVLFIGMVVLLRRRYKNKTIGWPIIILVLAIYFILLLLDGGLRGSRADVVFGLLWAGMIVNFTLKPIDLKRVMVFMSFIFLFMTIFYFYKHGGISALENVSSASTRDSVFSKQTATSSSSSTDEDQGNAEEFTLLHDFGRADIQALALYKISTSNYDLAYGRSYIGGLLSIIPRSVTQDRYPTVLKERTELLYGKNSYIDNGTFFCPWIFGLPGEAALNFGFVGYIFSFAVYGFFVRYLSKKIATIKQNDSRIYLVPFLVNTVIISMIGDSQLVVFAVVKFGFIPYLTILAISQRISLRKNSKNEVATV